MKERQRKGPSFFERERGPVRPSLMLKLGNGKLTATLASYALEFSKGAVWASRGGPGGELYVRGEGFSCVGALFSPTYTPNTLGGVWAFVGGQRLMASLKVIQF